MDPIAEFDPFEVKLPRAHRYVRYWEDNESFSIATAGYNLPVGFAYDTDDYDDDGRANIIAPAVTWTVDGQILSPNATASCLPTPTSSSTFRDDGAYLHVNWETEEPEVVFPGMDGCPSLNRSAAEWYYCL